MDLGSATNFLEKAAKYFETRETGGEDRAYWANVFNAQNCREIAAFLEAQAKTIAALQEAKDTGK